MKELLFIAALPVILICLYVYKKDVEKEPKTLLRKLMLWGIFSIIPVVVIEYILDIYLEIDGTEPFKLLFTYCFIEIGLTEELAKWIVSYKVVYKNPDFNESYDAIVYAVFASLGFALIENVLYVLPSGIITGLLRAFTAIPAHTCTGVLMGYFIGKAKIGEICNNKTKSKLYLVCSLLVPSLVHAMYDAIAFSKESTWIALIMFTIILYIISFLIIKSVSKNNVKFNNNCF